ncbi:putative serine dehydratase domain-domain-containing protein [Naematelia encephala]|uniref:D-serine dehydratase n=1 Tax=Naematelia encephala TaxID=71784 RepID=A0A1Y2AKJ5_9TREE|nr:putative serine dehydratase domain-domain-containing protein [Naematelia encephala]
MSSTTTSTFTPLSLLPLPDKAQVNDAFVGRSLSSLRTPALVVDRGVFKENCERVTLEAERRGMRFRAHVKTHKTIEGTRLQATASHGVKAFIASTLPEVWSVVQSGLFTEDLANDILYSMPVSADKLEDLNDAQEKIGNKGVLRLMLDHPAQVAAIEGFNARFKRGAWSVFLKVDGGGRRAGAPPESEQMRSLIKACLASSAVDIYGFYSHFGQSYASTSLDKATAYYHSEIECVNAAAKVARSLGANGQFVLSVGATPTAHAATQTPEDSENLQGELELHAGCYCMNDLQQLATTLIDIDACALTVLARVVSVYPLRNEAMCDAGAIAFSKDTGPFPGFGRVVHPDRLTTWDVGRISQEHGTLVHRPGVEEDKIEQIDVGDLVRIVPQHACLVCAAFPWIYVVDGSDEVVDVWIPFKGW